MNKMQIFKKLGDDVMPIVGFYGPPDEAEYEGKIYKSLKTDEMFKMIKEGGFNVTMQMNDPVEHKSEIVKKTLDLCEKYNILYLLCTSDLYKTNNWRKDDEFKYGSESFNKNVDSIISTLTPYIFHKASGGVYVWDEPSKKDLPYVGTIIDTFNEALKKINIDDQMLYVNLLPWNKNSGNSVEEYLDYMDKAIKEAHLSYLSYDSYPFVYKEVLEKIIPEVKKGISPGIYNMAAQVRQASLKNNVPFWGFVQMGGNWTEEIDNKFVRRPTSEEVIWEVNVLLAYGAKGIQYYTLNNPVSAFKYLKNHGETGAFLPDGTKSNLFNAAKNANNQIKACDEILMHATSEKIIVHGEMPTIMEYSYGVTNETKYRELKYVRGDSSLIGCFDFNNKTVLYVVNNDVENRSKIELVLDKIHLIRMIDRNIDKKISLDKIELNMNAGEAILVEIME